MSEENKTSFITARLVRITYEHAYVSVPVDENVLEAIEEDKFKIDYNKLAAEAIRIGTAKDPGWKFERTDIEIHPVQNPHPDTDLSA